MLDFWTDESLQDHKTFKKGFNRLHEKYAESLAKVAALEQGLRGYRDECQQLGAQVMAANNANSALRKVRVFRPHLTLAQTRLLMHPQEVHQTTRFHGSTAG